MLNCLEFHSANSKEIGQIKLAMYLMLIGWWICISFSCSYMKNTVQLVLQLLMLFTFASFSICMGCIRIIGRYFFLWLMPCMRFYIPFPMFYLQLIDVGVLVCFDSFLSLLTIMPTRIAIVLWRLMSTR